jgi:hypothetical protein
MTKVELFFAISEFEDELHDEISKILNINPDIIMEKGALKPPRTIPFKRNEWIIDASKISGNFAEQLNYLIDLLTPKLDILCEYNKKYKCEFSCALYFFDKTVSTPHVYFDEKYNAFIKNLPINFDFDIYI